MPTSTRRRFGRIRKLPSGRWQARYTGPDGRERTATDTFTTKTDAGRFLTNVETDLGRGTWLDPSVGAVRLRDYADGWLEQRTVAGRPLAPRTVANYRGLLDRHVLPRLGAVALSALTPALVRTWHAEVARAGQTTARQSYALLHAVLVTAVDDGALPRNPCALRGAGVATAPERPLLDREQAEALSEAMPGHLRAFVLLAFWGGLRLGELLALERRDLDLEAGTVRVERQDVEVAGRGVLTTPPKVASARTVHLAPPAVEALREHLAARPSGLPTARVFTRPSGVALRGSDVHAAWRRARAAVPGAPEGVHIHDLRHAGLTLAAQSGGTLAEVMRRAGHRTPRAALTYQHAAERRDAEVANLMAKTGSAGTTRSVRARSGHADLLDLVSKVAPEH